MLVCVFIFFVTFLFTFTDTFEILNFMHFLYDPLFSSRLKQIHYTSLTLDGAIA